MLRPNFERSQIGDIDSLDSHTSNLLSVIPRDGSTVDLQPLFFQLTIDTATEFLFGASTNSLTTNNPAFSTAFDNLMNQIGFESRLGPIARWMRPKNWGEQRKTVHDFADKYVRQALQRYRQADLEKNEKSSTSDRYVFLDEVVKVTQDPGRVRAELLNILIAGRDTTAGLLSIVWFMLAKRPDVFEKLQAEVDELGGDKPTYEQLRDMKYLKHVLNESKYLLVTHPASQPRSYSLLQYCPRNE